MYCKTFKGYEDRVAELDIAVNSWIKDHSVDVIDIKTMLCHEMDSRAKSGDLIYTVLYRAEAPI